ncbi:MAG TPA: TetR family transcriptional regulator [Rugosimonospora sp.]|nr:TetR family transcriptional regulator [Rugosimonospora sp.]
MSDQRPYAALLAKGQDRKLRIIAVAQRLLTRNGWRSTTLEQIARGAGISPAGLLHHFESKEQLLHAVLDDRDTYDDVNADVMGDLPAQVAKVADRFLGAPQQVGMFTILLVENLDPEAPLRERLLGRYRSATELIADNIRQGQREGRYRADLDPPVKAGEILAFITGMEMSWLLDPSIPLAAVFQGYAASLARDFSPRSRSS